MNNIKGKVRQLFPKTEDNPDGHEPRPDKSRLLTPTEIGNALDVAEEKEYPRSVGSVSTINVDYLVSEQDAKTASIKDAECQQKVKQARRDEANMILLQLVERLGYEISEGHIVDGKKALTGQQGGKK